MGAFVATSTDVDVAFVVKLLVVVVDSDHVDDESIHCC